MQYVKDLLDQYGYFILFAGLLLELVALPTPGELLMSYCGYLVYQCKLNWAASIFISAAGAATGITISYILGYFLGKVFFLKYGPHIHMGPERIEKVSTWFARYGNKLLVIAYFIPGVRHVTGYFSGITRIPFNKFALNAYLGAFIWTGTFISIGWVLGPKWESFHGSIKMYLIIGGLIAAVGLAVYYVYKNHKNKIIDFTIRLLNSTIKTYNSLGRVKAEVTGIAISFLGLIVLVAGLVRDYLSNEFRRFDSIVSLLVQLIFIGRWSYVMNLFLLITSPTALIALTSFILACIMLKGKNKSLEIRFLFVVILGGFLLQEGLGIILHRLGPLVSYIINNGKHTFPSEQAYMVVIVYCFASYTLLRHTDRGWRRPLIIATVLTICLFSGFSEVYFHIQYPSDVAAGYVFGGVWISLNIVLLEVFRILPEVQKITFTKKSATQ